jgi:peroxiredoxin
LRDGFKEFQSLAVTVFGISVDSIFSHKAFAENLKISFQLLSDFNKEVCSAYNVMHEEILGLKGIAKRSAFLIDSSGIVRYTWVSDDPGKMPDLSLIQDAIRKLNG